MATEGLYRMPTTLHVTYCGRTGVTTHEIDTVETKVDCDDCFQAKAWEDIDAAEDAKRLIGV
jgi:hypothetical protein